MAGRLDALAAPQPTPWRADRLLLKPKAGYDRAQLDVLKARHGLQLHKSYAGLEELQVLKVPPGGEVPEIVQALAASGLVEYAEPDFRVHATLVSPNDPQYTDGTQWNLNNPAGTGDLNAPEGWGIMNSASNIVVAVIDSGIRYTHQDLAANLWRNPREIAGNGQDDDGNGLVDDIYGFNAVGSPNTTNIVDDLGHGTHVSGIIGAVGNNGLGVAGVAWKVQIMSCKFLDSTGNGYISDAVECFDYARLNGAKVINASFGSTNYSSALDTAINACRSAGIIVVAAAGNESADNDTTGFYPANLGVVNGRDNVVAVAATDRYDQLAYFSNYGSNNVHLAAPGYGIYSTYFQDDASYTYLSGTSMAAPHVTGVLALMRARYPLENYQQIIKRMLEAVDVLPSLAGRCRTSGRVNLYKALANYQILNATYNWITVTNAATLTLANDGVSAARALPFPFNFYGQNYSQVYVGANGLLGFIAQGLNLAANTDLSGTNAPLAVICPFWDDLNPANGGTVTYGTNGAAPNRQVVISWNAVPRANSSVTKVTFQAVLNENSQQVVVQYLEVQPTRANTGGGGRSATVGIRSPDGSQAARYTVNGSPYVLANKTAFAFVPLATSAFEIAPKTSLVATGPTGGPFDTNSRGYVLTNQGNTTLTWQAVLSKDWVSLTATNGVLPAGQSVGVTLSLNANASLLPAGNHSATANFLLAGNAEPVAALTVSLTVLGTNAVLEVTPAAELNASGYTGGPFAPGNTLYTLINPGDAVTAWSAASSQTWLALSPTNGSLAPGGSVVVSAAINTNANSLPPGSFTNIIEFLNLTTGNGDTARVVTLQVNQRPGILAVMPAEGLNAVGVTGETFAPTSMVYTLTNAGTGPLDWAVTASQPWVTIFPTNGLMAPGETMAVTVSLDAAIEALTPDTYYATIEFLNTTTGAGNTTRTLVLQVNPKPGKLLVLPEATSLTITGMAGGPIAFTNYTLVLTNAGGTNLFWSAADEQSWLVTAPTDGSLMAAESTNLLVTLSSNAFILAAGSHTNRLRITSVNGTNSVHEIAFVLELAAPPPTNSALSIFPTNALAVYGLLGGPFSTGVVYTLVNTGDLATSWSVVCAEPWVRLDPTNGVLEPGATNEVSALINSNATLLATGQFSAVIEFQNLTTGSGNANRSLELSIQPWPGLLVIEPEIPSITITGVAGGPIVFTNQSLLLSNAGGSSLSWLALWTSNSNWLEIAPPAGTLLPGESTNVMIALSSNAFALPAGTHTTALRFADDIQSIYFTLELAMPPPTNAALIILPANDESFTGLAGGPFLPASLVYSLMNTGDLATSWEVELNTAWLSLSATNGLLEPGGTNEVVITVNSNALAFSPGDYPALLAFHNLTTGSNELTRAISLVIYPPPGVLLVTPETNRIALAGYVGGPIWFTNQSWSLTNAGGSNLAWNATLDSDWLLAAPTNGVLLANETTNLLVALATNAFNLSAGSYTNRLVLTPQPGTALIIEFQLQLLPPPALSASLTPGGIQFQLPAIAGRPYVLDCSTNLIEWIPWVTNVGGTDGSLQITNEAAQLRQFFRVRVE